MTPCCLAAWALRRCALVASVAILVALLAAACGGDGDGATPTPAPTTPAVTPTSEPATATPAATVTLEATPTPVAIAPGDPLVLGVSAALEGDPAPIGNDILGAVKLAVADFGGELAGHPIEVVAQPDGCDQTAQAVEAATALIATAGLVAVVGPMCSNGALAANPLYEAAFVNHISPYATRSEVSQQGMITFFRTAFQDGAQGVAQAAYLAALGVAEAAVVEDGEPYGEALADAFTEAFSALGGTARRLQLLPGDTDFAPLTRPLTAAPPEAVVFEGFNPEAKRFYEALRAAGYEGPFVAAEGAFSLADFIEPLGEQAEGVVFSGCAPELTEEVREPFEEVNGAAPRTGFVAAAWDAATILLRALQEVAVAGEDGTLTVDPVALNEAIRRTSLADGLSGPIAFNEHGDRTGTTPAELGVGLCAVQNGLVVPVEVEGEE